MNSPDNIPFIQFIKLDRRKSDPVYLQIVYQFIQAVQTGLLEEGDKIPGSRTLSKELKVHRKTVIAALEELQMQGWVTPKPAVGTFVSNAELNAPKGSPSPPTSSLKEKPEYSFNKNYILDAIHQKSSCQYRFTTGEPDYRIIKANELGRFYSSALKRKSILKKIPDYLPQGNTFFKEQLNYYINLTRRFHISKSQLMTTNSKHVLLYILTQLLVQKGDTILVADYSYPFSNMIFQQAGATIKTVPMDKEGMQIEYIRKNYKPGALKFIYIQPQHQYPTTVCLSQKRREELIDLAEEYHFIILEDDAHYELTFEKSFTPPLIKSKGLGRVIYIGNFGRFLTPGFQTNFLIAHEEFIKEAEKYLPIFGRMDLIKEQALGEMIYEGDIHRYRRKALNVYQSRRDQFAEQINEIQPHQLVYTVPGGGLAFWLQFNSALSLSRLVESCHQKGLFIPRTCLYQNKNITALRLGYAHLNKEEMEGSLNILSQVLLALSPPKKEKQKKNETSPCNKPAPERPIKRSS